MEDDVSWGGGGHPEVDFPALRVRQEASDLSARWNSALDERTAPVWPGREWPWLIKQPALKGKSTQNM